MKLTAILTVATLLAATPVHSLYLMELVRPLVRVFSPIPTPDLKPVPGNSGIKQCQIASSQLLTVQKVDIAPSPPVRGQNLTFSAAGLLAKPVTAGAYAHVTVRYGLIKMIDQIYDICDEIPKIDLSCPIEQGQINITKSVEIPAEVPPGKYVVQVEAFTAKDELITCLWHSIEF